MAKREKTVSYRRAAWLDEAQGLTLERCIRDAAAKLKSIPERTISHGGQDPMIVKLKDCPDASLLLHLTVETPGESASVVPRGTARVQEIDLAVVKPPPLGEWLDGDAFLYVNDDHVCVCATGVHEAAIRYFLYELFKKAKLHSLGVVAGCRRT